MAEEPQLASGSDSDDDDYVPEGVAAQLSEEESGSGSDNEGEEGTKRKKGKSSRKRATKKSKVEETETKEVKKESPEELKKKSDALWADFLKDVPCKKTNADEPRVAPSDEKDNSDEKVKLTQVYEFAGEKVKVEREVPVNPVQTSTRGRGRGRGGGISSILGQLGKKGKLSVLEKSKLDWDKFKSDEGIGEEIKTHNRGKNGYLERQDFLQRADLRQFEIEKGLRASKRSLL